MKVFISHQKTDADIALRIANRLRINHSIDSYVDVIDSHINDEGCDLADYIRTEMAKCTQLIAVISYSTKDSQWVPWEIGVASEKNFPLATFANMQSKPPEFLEKWPVMRSIEQVDVYAQASKAAQRIVIAKKASMLNESRAQKFGADEFYRSMKVGLRPKVY